MSTLQHELRAMLRVKNPRRRGLEGAYDLAARIVDDAFRVWGREGPVRLFLLVAPGERWRFAREDEKLVDVVTDGYTLASPLSLPRNRSREQLIQWVFKNIRDKPVL